LFNFSRSFNWKNSKAHLLLLSKFIYPREPKYYYDQDNWARVLNEPAQKSIKRFINENMLVNADLEYRVSYKYKVHELKELLKQRGLSISGIKKELVSRIVLADRDRTSKLVADVEHLLCTQSGREIAQKYISEETDKRNKVEQQVMILLKKQMFEEAIVEVSKYEAEQVFPRGIGIDWKHYDTKREIAIMNLIFKGKPEIMSKLEDVNLEPLQIGAAMMEIWGESTATKWLPTDFKTGLLIDNDSAARMLIFNATNNRNLRQYKERGIKFVEVLGAPTSCPFCKEIANKRFVIDEAPILPNPNCSHELGCRCLYLACVE
jgi:hypothetical protein